MLIPDISCFENSVDPNQLVSQKPADQGPHCFPLCLKIHAITGIMQVKWIKIWEE